MEWIICLILFKVALYLLFLNMNIFCGNYHIYLVEFFDTHDLLGIKLPSRIERFLGLISTISLVSTSMAYKILCCSISTDVLGHSGWCIVYNHNQSFKGIIQPIKFILAGQNWFFSFLNDLSFISPICRHKRHESRLSSLIEAIFQLICILWMT